MLPITSPVPPCLEKRSRLGDRISYHLRIVIMMYVYLDTQGDMLSQEVM